MSELQVSRARREAEAARQRLFDDVRQLQDRLSPTSLAEEAVETVKAKSKDAVGVARRNPIVATAGALGLLALVARRPIARIIRRWRDEHI